MKKVRCFQCGETLYEKVNVINTPWSEEAYKRTLHDINGNELSSCPRCGYTGKIPELSESAKRKFKEEFESGLRKRFPHLEYHTREGRTKWFPNMRFKDLIYGNYEKMTMTQVHEAVQSEIANLNELENKASEILIDITNAKANTKDFWNKDCDVVFNEIWDDAEKILEELEVKINDYIIFSLFQIVVLNFSYFAHEHKKFRGFINPSRKKYYRWIHLFTAGGYILYHISIGEWGWSTFIIAGILIVVVEGYFFTRR